MKAVIFDLDGTLVESLAGLTSTMNLTLNDLELPPISAATVRSYIGDGMWMLIRRALPLELFTDAEVTKAEPIFQAHYAREWRKGTEVYAGIPALLQELQERGIQLGVLSNKKHPFTVEIVEELFSRELLPLIYGQRDGVPKKPDPTALLSIAAETGFSAEELVYVGDSTVDLETAQGAGTKGIGVTWGYHDKDRLTPYPFPLVDSVAEFRTVLLSLLH